MHLAQSARRSRAEVREINQCFDVADTTLLLGSGKDVNSESIADAARPVRVRWHVRSHVEIQTGKP